ncbi:inositol monophosphatase, partial [Candidatus Uhrbacteria bacterium]|nr:inositol monophosphatase [Candidatus Uhrbacteria bacterium]MBD3284593.1 inositol monophosphatase [Candidatus Uhrbacteria bacterium]
PWDIAAGALLVREAGGKSVNLNGKPWKTTDADIIMCGPSLLPAILKTIRAT